MKILNLASPGIFTVDNKSIAAQCMSFKLILLQSDLPQDLSKTFCFPRAEVYFGTTDNNIYKISINGSHGIITDRDNCYIETPLSYHDMYWGELRVGEQFPHGQFVFNPEILRQEQTKTATVNQIFLAMPRPKGYEDIVNPAEAGLIKIFNTIEE